MAQNFSWLRPDTHGIRVVPAGAWIDPAGPVDLALVTHGHGDHARGGHGRVVATRETLAIMGLRYGAAASEVAAPYGEGVELPGGVRATFIPAGHVLGSAQILLEHAGERVVVTGDYKRRADPTCQPFEPVPCDLFVTEATFGLPVFRHPPIAGEIAKLLAARAAQPGRCVLDGELLVRGAHQGGEAGGAASFNALQQRLGRKAVSKRMLEDYPAFVRLYDVLIVEQEDLRALAWEQRRELLEAFSTRLDPARFDLSPVIAAASFEELAEIPSRARDEAIEGVMLKHRASPYVTGRRTGLWYKWKRDPLLVDCVLMYAQRGSGKRSSFYSDFTFGCWNGDPDAGAELLPVGKAYFGFTDEELKWLDRHVRHHTVARFGPVRETDKSLVLEVAFDSVHESRRHKSGLAMRFPRINRIRADKPAHEADRIESLRALVRD